MATLDELLVIVSSGLPMTNGVDPLGATTILPAVSGEPTIGSILRPWTAVYADNVYTGNLIGATANVTFTGNVALPSSTTYNGTNLETILGSKASIATPVSITECTASDTWIITTDNSSGALYTQVTCALDPASASAIATKPSPVFTSATATIVSVDWPSTNGWLVSSNSFLGGYEPWMGTFGGGGPGVWYTATGSFSGGIGNVYWCLQYPTAVNVQSFTFRADSGAGDGPLVFAMQYSDDNAAWNVAQNYSIPSSSYTGDTTLSFAVPSSGSHQYWRINITKVVVNTNNRTHMSAIRFYTGFTANGLKLSSVCPISSSQFKLVMTDVVGDALNAVDIPIPLPFYITLIKDSKIVNTGLYTLSLGTSNGSPGVITTA